MSLIIILIALLVAFGIGIAACLLNRFYTLCRLLMLAWCITLDVFIVAMFCMVVKAVLFV